MTAESRATSPPMFFWAYQLICSTSEIKTERLDSCTRFLLDNKHSNPKQFGSRCEFLNQSGHNICYLSSTVYSSLETSLIWIGCDLTWAIGRPARVCSECSRARGHTGKLSKQFQEASQSVCHGVFHVHIWLIFGTIWSVMKRIAIVRWLYIPFDVTFH